MNAFSVSAVHQLRPRILERRARLQAVSKSVSAEYVHSLLAEIDATLARIDHGRYGLCETCHDPIEADRLERNPLERFCLDHLTDTELRAHEQDLELATQIQARLLPAHDISTAKWEAHFRYEPAGMVGGDYCEIIPARDGSGLFFALGDVTGKGVAASLLMTHLSAIFRSLVSLDMPLCDILPRANRLFCASTPTTHYATLVAGRTTENGIELCNAGHCRPLLLRPDGVVRIDSTGLPLGLFCEGKYDIGHLSLEPCDRLVLYSDGITEAENPDTDDYGEERLIACLQAYAGRAPAEMAGAVLKDLATFRGSRPRLDDVTLLVVRRGC